MNGEHTVWDFQNAQTHSKQTPGGKDTHDFVGDSDLQSVHENEHKCTRLDAGKLSN